MKRFPTCTTNSPRHKTLYAEKQAYLLTKTLRLQTMPAAVKLWESIDAKDLTDPFEKLILKA